MTLSHKLIIPAIALLSSTAFSSLQAQVIEYKWSSASSGNWSTAANWAVGPDFDSQPSENPGASTFRWDRVTIDREVTVTRTGDLNFWTSGTAPSGKTGTFNAIALSGNGNLIVDGKLDLRGSSGGYVRNALIGAGSTMTVEELLTGASNSTGVKSTWTINGTLNVTTFRGSQASATSGLDGGYILNVNGGSLNVSGTFNWRAFGNVSNLSRTGRINISNNGVVDIGTMGTDWLTTGWGTGEGDILPGSYVNFVDGSGSLKFGSSNWDLAAVNSLISNGYIRKDAAVEGTISVVDADGDWLVTVNQIPEASTTVALLSAAAFAAVCFVRRRKSRA